MCEFLSFYLSDDGRTVWPGDLRSHTKIEELHGLTDRLSECRPPIPCEWTEDGEDDASLICRPSATNSHDAEWYKDELLNRWLSEVADYLVSIGLAVKQDGEYHLACNRWQMKKEVRRAVCALPKGLSGQLRKVADGLDAIALKGEM